MWTDILGRAKQKLHDEKGNTSKFSLSKPEERGVVVTSLPDAMLPPAATRKAPPMSAGAPWPTDDGRSETLSFRLKAAFFGRLCSAEMDTLAKELVIDGWSETIADDIMKLVELSRREDVTNIITVVQEGLLVIFLPSDRHSQPKKYWRSGHQEEERCVKSSSAMHRVKMPIVQMRPFLLDRRSQLKAGQMQAKLIRTSSRGGKTKR